MGIETMLANRVAVGPSVEPPRFRWVPYADALIFPLDNSRLAAQNPDRQAFFPLEDKLRARYLTEAGVSAMPATLAEYLTRVVTPTLERHKKGGAVAPSRPTRTVATISGGNRPCSTTPGIADSQAASAAGSSTGPW